MSRTKAAKPGPQSVAMSPAVDPVSLLWPRSMSVETAARYIDATPWNVEELCRSGQIVAYKQGKRWTVDRLELDRYVSRRHAEAAALLSDFVKNSQSGKAA
jgi:excisionase family DNA binding protein